MPIALRHRDDPAPMWPRFPGLHVRREVDAARLARLQEKAEDEMTSRLGGGHRAYIAWRDAEPAAWGWVATRSAFIGELGTSFDLPKGTRYLWNFVTLKQHRGLGIYPRLLDVIVREESAEAEHFWIAYAPENHASGSGTRKAGFTRMADLSFDEYGHPVAKSRLPGGGAKAAQMLGLRSVDKAVAPCWRCARAPASADSSCSPGRCTCDYQRPEVACS